MTWLVARDSSFRTLENLFLNLQSSQTARRLLILTPVLALLEAVTTVVLAGAKTARNCGSKTRCICDGDKFAVVIKKKKRQQSL